MCAMRMKISMKRAHLWVVSHRGPIRWCVGEVQEISVRLLFWVFSKQIWHLSHVRRVLPGFGNLASFFRDPRTSSLYGNTRNFINVRLTYVLEMKEICHGEPKELL